MLDFVWDFVFFSQVFVCVLKQFYFGFDFSKNVSKHKTVLKFASASAENSLERSGEEFWHFLPSCVHCVSHQKVCARTRLQSMDTFKKRKQFRKKPVGEDEEQPQIQDITTDKPTDTSSAAAGSNKAPVKPKKTDAKPTVKLSFDEVCEPQNWWMQAQLTVCCRKKEKTKCLK